MLFPGETGLFPTKAASSASDRVPDPSASIAATNARTSAGEASRFVIEEIKAKLPIWKFEAYSGGTAIWQ